MVTASSPYTLVFAIGPVQGFLTQSRRTADGWVGSFLLSYLSGRAIKALKDRAAVIHEPHLGGVSLFEVIENGSSAGDTTVAAIPNVVVLSAGRSVAEPEVLGDLARGAVVGAWTEIADEIWGSLPSDITARAAVHAIWHRQVSSHWEVYWAWAEGDSASREAFVNLAARKGLRDFDPIEEKGDRCTVCGQREALWDEGERRQRGDHQARDVARRLWRDWSERIVANLKASSTVFQPNGKERLCAICLVRRLIPWCENPIRNVWRAGSASGTAPSVFPSTSTMATVIYRTELVQKAAKSDPLRVALACYYGILEKHGLARYADPLERFPCWQKTLGDVRGVPDFPAERLLRLDGDWYLYGDAVRNELELPNAVHDEVAAAYGAVLKAARESGLDDPPIYWALLTMDGDRMGDFKEAAAAAKIPTDEISGMLNRFAREVPEIVTRHDGRVIYAGGDDVLAFLPVATALDAADELRRRYRDLFEDWAKAKAALGVPTSLSASIVYAHHQAPLGRVIQAGHQLLTDLAKRRADRDSLAIGIYGRGGLTKSFASKWASRTGEELVARLKWVAGALGRSAPSPAGSRTTPAPAGSGQAIGSRLFYRLREEAWMFGPAGPFSSEAEQEEYVGMVLTKSRLPGADRPANERREEARTTAKKLLGLCRDAVAEDGGAGLPVEPLLVARFLAQGGREARG
jgi:CRISPR-associated protein Cmr2